MWKSRKKKSTITKRLLSITRETTKWQQNDYDVLFATQQFPFYFFHPPFFAFFFMAKIFFLHIEKEDGNEHYIAKHFSCYSISKVTSNDNSNTFKLLLELLSVLQFAIKWKLIYFHLQRFKLVGKWMRLKLKEGMTADGGVWRIKMSLRLSWSFKLSLKKVCEKYTYLLTFKALNNLNGLRLFYKFLC